MINDPAIKKIVTRFRNNWFGYLIKYRGLLIITFLAALADMISTSYFMLHDSPAAEVHPVVRMVSMIFGPIVGPFIGKVCQFSAVVLVTVYLRAYALYVFISVIVLYTWAAWYNIWGTHLYKPRLLAILEYIGG